MPSDYSSARSTTNREVVKAMLPAPCTKCRRIVTSDMKWEADHITGRAIAKLLGWTTAMVDAPSNLGPAHASCNHRDNKRGFMTSKGKPTRRVPRVERPSFPRGVFSDEQQNPAPCPPNSLPDLTGVIS